MLTGFWQGALSAPEATWNLHTTQPRYFAPTCSEVVNLTGLLKTNDETYHVEKDICLQ
jgi:hypothetical protein